MGSIYPPCVELGVLEGKRADSKGEAVILQVFKKVICKLTLSKKKNLKDHMEHMLPPPPLPSKE